jgi:cation diffusion facilitator CzcD-associated flavoprotein CzcO
MRAAIADPALREALTPDYEPGCKRILFSDDYYSALARDHVTLVPRGVKRLSRKGVVDAAGEEHPADIVIFCTGYRLGGREDGSPAVEVYGRGGPGAASPRPASRTISPSAASTGSRPIPPFSPRPRSTAPISCA